MEKIKLFGENAEFEHVGIAVSSISRLVAAKKTPDPNQHVSLAFINLHGCRVELIESLDDSSPISGILKKGVAVYHLCFKVPDLELALEVARNNGFHCFSGPSKAAAFKNKRIAFIYNKDWGIFELLEK